MLNFFAFETKKASSKYPIKVVIVLSLISFFVSVLKVLASFKAFTGEPIIEESITKKALYFNSLLNKNCRENLRIFQSNTNELRNELPHSFFFWENWFCAKDYVYKYLDSGNLEHLENAVKWYGLAFENGKYFMGKSAEQFIHEAIIVSVYLDMKKNPTKARTKLQKNFRQQFRYENTIRPNH